MEIFKVDRHTYQKKELFKLKIHTDSWTVINGFQRATGIYRKQLGRCIKKGYEEVVCRWILTQWCSTKTHTMEDINCVKPKFILWMSINQPPTLPPPKLNSMRSWRKFPCCWQKPNLPASTDHLKFREYSGKNKPGTQKQISIFFLQDQLRHFKILPLPCVRVLREVTHYGVRSIL